MHFETWCLLLYFRPGDDSDSDESTDARDIYRESIVDQINPLSGTSDYRKAIQDMRHGARKEKSSVFKPVCKQSSAGPALITENSYIGDHSDWLDDDLGILNERQKPATKHPVVSTPGSRKRSSDAANRRSSSEGKENEFQSTKRRREKSPPLTSTQVNQNSPAPDFNVTSHLDTNDVHDDQINEVVIQDDDSNSGDAFRNPPPVTPDSRNRLGLKKKPSKQVTLTSMGLGSAVVARANTDVRVQRETHSDSPVTVPASQVTPTLLMRLKVKIQDKLILVPIAER